MQSSADVDRSRAEKTLHPYSIGPAPKHPKCFTDEEVKYLTVLEFFFGKFASRIRKSDIVGDSWHSSISRSLNRADMKQPPTCIVCFGRCSDDEYIQRKLGCLLWFPEYPAYFAVHETCLIMSPCTINAQNDPSPATVMLLSITIESIAKDVQRSLTLKCTGCAAKKRAWTGGAIGCHLGRCSKNFHLPCAIEAGCQLNFNDYEIRCNKHFLPQASHHSNVLSVNSHYVQSDEATLQLVGEKELISASCLICFESIEEGKRKAIYREIIMGLIESPRNIICEQSHFIQTVFTNCCSTLCYHFECMESFAMSRGLELRCPACNNDEQKLQFQEMLQIQGIHTYHVDPDEGGPNNVELGVCAASYSGKCLCPEGPSSYTARETGKVYKWELLNDGCTGCSANIHRFCAGSPWNDLKSDEFESTWNCEDCRPHLPPSSVPYKSLYAGGVVVRRRLFRRSGKSTFLANRLQLLKQHRRNKAVEEKKMSRREREDLCRELLKDFDKEMEGEYKVPDDWSEETDDSLIDMVDTNGEKEKEDNTVVNLNALREKKVPDNEGKKETPSFPIFATNTVSEDANVNVVTLNFQLEKSDVELVEKERPKRKRQNTTELGPPAKKSLNMVLSRHNIIEIDIDEDEVKSKKEDVQGTVKNKKDIEVVTIDENEEIIILHTSIVNKRRSLNFERFA